MEQWNSCPWRGISERARAGKAEMPMEDIPLGDMCASVARILEVSTSRLELPLPDASAPAACHRRYVNGIMGWIRRV